MTSYDPQQSSPPGAAPVRGVVVPPEINKALWPAIMTILGVISQFVESGEFNAGQEGLTALFGAIATVLAFAASNYKKGLGFGKPSEKPTKVEVVD